MRRTVGCIWLLYRAQVSRELGRCAGAADARAASWPAQGLAAIFTVVLLIALLPIIGVYGAAIASTVAYGAALAAMLRSLRHLPRHTDRRSIQLKRQIVRRRGRCVVSETASSATSDGPSRPKPGLAQLVRATRRHYSGQRRKDSAAGLSQRAQISGNRWSWQRNHCECRRV